MARLILLIAVLFAGYYFWLQYKRCKPEERRKYLLKSGFWVLLAVLVVLAATGRMHWVGAAIAAMIPIVKSLIAMAVRVLPFLNLRKKQQQQNQDQAAATYSANLTEEEAWQILGLEPGASKEAIVTAHKKLIQKLHPDRGGNDYLASRINQAKDLLLQKYS